jgi:hypothetical protein
LEKMRLTAVAILLVLAYLADTKKGTFFREVEVEASSWTAGAPTVVPKAGYSTYIAIAS